MPMPSPDGRPRARRRAAANREVAEGTAAKTTAVVASPGRRREATADGIGLKIAGPICLGGFSRSGQQSSPAVPAADRRPIVGRWLQGK